MRAAVYRGVDDVRMDELPIPEIGAGEALVRIRACGVCGTDLKKIHHGLVPPPRIFGHEMAGEIAAVGDGVAGWSVGDRAAVMHHVPCLDCYYCRQKTFAQCATYKKTGTTAGFEPAGGGFAEYIRVMDWVVRRGMVRIPPDATYEEAAFIEPLNTCLKAVRKAGVREGHAALVMGQGPIGLLFTQILRIHGARVVATDPLEHRRKLGLSYGATAAYPPGSHRVKRTVSDLTDGRGADRVFVTAASPQCIFEALELSRPGGAVLLFAQTKLQEAVELDAGAICMQEKDLIGSYSSDITLQEEVAGLIFSRKIDVHGLITHRFPLDQIDQGIALASHPAESSLKVMMVP